MVDLNKVKALASQAAEIEDQTETTTFEASIPPVGPTVARFTTYVDLGKQPRTYNGKPQPPADSILLAELVKALDAMPGSDKVMLKLSIPATPGLFDPLVAHPRVLRVVALSGGFARPEACAELAKNKGMIASFSRALLEDLRHSMSDEEFDASLGGAIDAIHTASTVKS